MSVAATKRAPRPGAHEAPQPTAAAGASIQLTSKPTLTWTLSRGRAHVFVTPLRDGVPLARRRHLFTVQAPAVLLSLPQGGDLLFEAVLEPDSEVAAGAPGDFSEGDFAAAVERWTKGLLAGCARHVPGRPDRDLTVRGEEVVPPFRVLEARPDLGWLRVTAGRGALLDLSPVGEGGLALTPLGGGAWIRSLEPLSVSPASTLDLLREGALAEALAAFHAAASGVIATALGLARLDEGLRRERRRARISADSQRVVGDLGRMVGAVAAYKVDPRANQTLFSAVHLVALRLGVRVRTPSAVRQDRSETEASLEEILRASALRARPVRLTPAWWRDGADNMVGWRAADGRPVALLRDRWGRYQAHDPQTGEVTAIGSANSTAFGEDAYVLYEPLPPKALRLRDLMFFGLQGSGADIAAMAAAAVLGALLGSAPAMLARTIFQTLIPQQQTALLAQAGAALALLALLGAGIVYSGAIAMARLRARASTRLKAALWDRILRQPMSFLSRYTAPDLTLRISTAENIVGAFHAMAQQSAVTLGFLLTNVVTMLFLSPPAAAAAIGLLGLLGGATWLAAWGQKRAFTLGEQAEGSVSTFVHALANGVRKLRLTGAEERAFVKWGERFTRSRIKLINVRRVSAGYATFLATFNMLALAGVFFVIAQLKGSPVSAGAFVGFVTAFGVSIASMANLGRVSLQLAFQMAAAPYMQPLLDAVPPPDWRKSSAGRLSGAVEVSNLVFRYGHDGPAVLGGVSFAAEPGEFLAIVGPSGCGKSTLVKLLLGLETPHGGAVLYDQTDLANMDPDGVRRQIGVVLQRSQLMAGSIFENLRGTTEIELDEAWEAARLAGIERDIRALPMGMHTLVSEGSQTISGGQRQRIALARALAHKPSLLILDEATSALDNATQGEVMRNMADLACTRIVIAHRLSTIMHADRIVVLDNGQVAETGSYAELVAAGGLFARMAARQSAGSFRSAPDGRANGDIPHG